MTARILVAAADPETASILELALAREGHDVQVAATVDHAMRVAHAQRSDLAVVDSDLPAILPRIARGSTAASSS